MRPSLTHLSLIALLAALPAAAQETPDADAAAETQTDDTAGDAAEPAADDTAADDTSDAPEAADEETGTTPAEAAEEPATPGERAIGDALDTGESANPTPPDERTFVKSEEGDWQVECIRMDDGSEGPCQLYQLLRAGEGNPVAEARVFKVEGGGQVVAGANFIVPLETLLTQKLTIAVDNGQPKRYDFAFCTQIGCIARVGFTAQDVNGFKRGAKATVSIVPALAPDQNVATEMSLSGFTSGYDQLSPIPAP